MAKRLLGCRGVSPLEISWVAIDVLNTFQATLHSQSGQGNRRWNKGSSSMALRGEQIEE
jgi:hypothetical protein